jgi:hypothetical protein
MQFFQDLYRFCELRPPLGRSFCSTLKCQRDIAKWKISSKVQRIPMNKDSISMWRWEFRFFKQQETIRILSFSVSGPEYSAFGAASPKEPRSLGRPSAETFRMTRGFGVQSRAILTSGGPISGFACPNPANGIDRYVLWRVSLRSYVFAFLVTAKCCSRGQ